MKKITNKLTSLFLILVLYLIAFLLVLLLFPLIPIEYSIYKVLAADIFATIVIFIFSLVFSNSSVYDPYWSVAPPLIGVYLIHIFQEGNSARQSVIFLLILFWSIRLTLNWLRGWKGFNHEDWRYVQIAQKTGKFYWPVSFLGIHLMPTLFVFLGCLPLWYSLSSRSAFNFFDVLATLFTFGAIMTEWVADEQLIRFRKNKEKSMFMRTGLWAISRHPNYLGEISFWLGMFLFVLSASELKITDGLWTGVGFISMAVLFKFISIPLMEKRNRRSKPGYENYMKEVPALIPHLFKK